MPGPVRRPAARQPAAATARRRPACSCRAVQHEACAEPAAAVSYCCCSTWPACDLAIFSRSLFHPSRTFHPTCPSAPGGLLRLPARLQLCIKRLHERNSGQHVTLGPAARHTGRRLTMQYCPPHEGCTSGTGGRLGQYSRPQKRCAGAAVTKSVSLPQCLLQLRQLLGRQALARLLHQPPLKRPAGTPAPPPPPAPLWPRPRARPAPGRAAAATCARAAAASPPAPPPCSGAVSSQPARMCSRCDRAGRGTAACRRRPARVGHPKPQRACQFWIDTGACQYDCVLPYWRAARNRDPSKLVGDGVAFGAALRWAIHADRCSAQSLPAMHLACAHTPSSSLGDS